MDLIFANDEKADNIALLYDMGQDSSKTPIENAKKYLEEISKLVGVKIGMVSIGAHRDESIVIDLK